MITDNDSHRNKLIELIKSNLVPNKINYVFDCLDEEKFNKIINSDISDEDLSTILSYVKKIRFNISNDGRRNLLILFKNLIDNEYVIKKILEYKLIQLIAKFNIGNENLLRMYRVHGVYGLQNLTLEREYQL